MDLRRRWPVAVAALTLAGCAATVDVPVAVTLAHPTPSRTPSPTPSPTTNPSSPPATAPAEVVPAAVVSPPVDRTVVLTGSGPGALSVAVSRALFRTAPVVVVTDRAGAAAAAGRSVPLGVPLLLTGDPAGDPAGNPTGDPAGDRSVRAEVRRLQARTVLASAPIPGLTVVTDPAALPKLAPPPPIAGLVVLVRAGDPAAPAVSATATAAGARVVTVHAADPRADPAAITALARLRPRQVVAAGAAFGPASRLATRIAVASTGVSLPGGGQVMFPGRRLVALYGHPGTGALGVLGEQGLGPSILRARAVAAPYRRLSTVPVVPAFEIIATVASGGPGPDGDYSDESSVAALRPWVTRAGHAGMYVVLDLQPGRASFLTQAKRYEPLLRLPYVGLALDPEWRLGPGQLPLRQIGGVASAEINQVSAWLSRVVAKYHLPQKLLVLHQFKLSMIRDEPKLNTGHDEVATLIHMDGQGAQPTKNGTWHAVVGAAPRGVAFGWKNFYDEDTPILDPAGTMRNRPTPLMISYQ
jgi:hypothetical protein